jgi:uncharacterized metal-binding protein YceD (DUF177 family)
MSALVLHVQEIDETGKDYSFELTPAWVEKLLSEASLRVDPAFPAGRLEVHAQQNGAEYLVNGTLSAHLLTDCGRCLRDAKVPVDVHIAALYHRTLSKAAAERLAKKHSSEELELSDEELQREEFVGNEIVLDDLVREHMVLEVPMQPLCSDDCEGIAVPEHLRPPPDVFGTKDEKVDPRLAPLQRLRDKVPPNPSRDQTRDAKRDSNKE